MVKDGLVPSQKKPPRSLSTHLKYLLRKTTLGNSTEKQDIKMYLKNVPGGRTIKEA